MEKTSKDDTPTDYKSSIYRAVALILEELSASDRLDADPHDVAQRITAAVEKALTRKWFVSVLKRAQTGEEIT